VRVTVEVVWQVIRKLKVQGLIESYRLKDNQKEVYFRLTDSGRIARERRYHEALNAECLNFLDRFNESQTKVISNFLGEMMKAVEGTIRLNRTDTVFR
jgi:DNA-binding MarR family transcriptional regulator